MAKTVKELWKKPSKSTAWRLTQTPDEEEGEE